jgi:hypothetical protein
MRGQRDHFAGMSKRATKRPEGFVKPAHWSNDPAPAPAPARDDADPAGLSPTRYGDWEKNGIAVDF